MCKCNSIVDQSLEPALPAKTLADAACGFKLRSQLQMSDPPIMTCGTTALGIPMLHVSNILPMFGIRITGLWQPFELPFDMQFRQKVANSAVYLARNTFDRLTTYNLESMNERKWLRRFLFLETIAGKLYKPPCWSSSSSSFSEASLLLVLPLVIHFCVHPLPPPHPPKLRGVVCSIHQ